MIKKAINILLAFVVLFSSTGIVLNKHYCQNQLKSVAIFFKAENCHDAAKTKVCPFHKNAAQDKKNCCNDDSEFFKIDQDQKIQLNDFELSKKTTIKAILPNLILEEKSFISKNINRYLTYKPPIVLKDISVLFQTFLI